MSAQNQAAMAGVPFDILTEADLTDVAKLAQYDTLIFPSFQNVPAAKVGAITKALTDAVYDYGVGLITAGNFMTNDETGAALPGDSYSRMKILLGVAPQGFAGAADVTLVAADAAWSRTPAARSRIPGAASRSAPRSSCRRGSNAAGPGCREPHAPERLLGHAIRGGEQHRVGHVRVHGAVHAAELVADQRRPSRLRVV
jgi:serralysin